MKTIRVFFFVAILLVPAGIVKPQAARSQPAETDSNMSKLDFMVGDWVGNGWIQMGREKKTFLVRESFKRKLGGSLVVVEGRGTNADPKTGKEQVIHSAYGVFYIDGESKKIAFRYFKEDGAGGLTFPEFSEKKMVWGFVAEPSKSKIKFTEYIDEEGFWVANGEVLPSGRDKWFPFFYMRLKKTE